MGRYLFGPILSRRFGLSLGIDLSPGAKQCNFDCLYCELEGKKATDSMGEVAKVEEILEELREALPRYKPDVITVTANGEPTLYPALLPLIRGINALPHSAKTLILSNGSRFGEPEVQEALLEFDMVKFSLDAVSTRAFKRVDRAHDSLSISQIIQGIKGFRSRYRGDLIAEVLFVKGVNDSPEEARAIARVLKEIAPSRVDLSTIDRPPAYKVEGVSPQKLEELASAFEGLNLFIAKRQSEEGSLRQRFSKEEILNTLKKRPWSQEDMERLLEEESKLLWQELLDEGKIERQEAGGVIFFRAR
ncbi:MAG: radical SAM protein [Wolinella succinogenes]|uniref:radical SAM protein n=1 Tax=Wolinella succinogenes TaxID=844 RepID=UPI00169F1D16|nr:radical SAM protein [Wolinella succinogenes]NLU33933.1 radical SAM protein [Wolinella succinogenes]